MKIKNLVKNTIHNTVRELDDIEITENYMTQIYETYANTKLDKETDIFAKVKLSKNREKALEVLINGLEYKGKKYTYLATSAGLMKNTGEYTECECYFCSDSDFRKEFENVISSGMLKTKVGEEVAINKDIIARISLSLSDIIYKVLISDLKFLILPELEYDFMSNYLQFKLKDKNTVDLDDLRLIEEEVNEKHIANDGCGFITPCAMDKINKQIISLKDKNTPKLSWLGIRQIGLATKGLLVKFDFKKYLKEELKLDELIVKDFWGTPQNIFDYDVIMNSSQTKWAKNFKSYKEYENLKNSDEFKKYEHLFNSLNITKVNKKECKEYTKTNYQLLSVLDLNDAKIKQLSEESLSSYKNVLNRDIDAIRIMLEGSALDKDEISATTKVHKLLQIDENYVDTYPAKRLIDNLTNKKTHLLAGGSFEIKANFKTIAQDPIAYFNRLAGRETKYELKPYEYFVNGELGERTVCRFPLSCPSEVIKAKLITNEIYDKYFGDMPNDLMFLPFDDSAQIMSGADYDLDIVYVVDNKIIYESVIEDKLRFKNALDASEPVKHIYDKEDKNLFNCILDGRGNKIGILANMSSKLNNISQKTIGYKYNKTKKVKQHDEWINYVLSKHPNLTREEVEETFNKALETEEFVRLQNTVENFKEYKVYEYLLLTYQMLAIDSPKTGIPVDIKKDLKIIKDLLQNVKKPLYLYHAKWKSKNVVVTEKECEYTDSVLNNHSVRIMNEVEKIKESQKWESCDDLFDSNLKSITIDYIKNNESNTELINKIKGLNDEYFKLRTNAPGYSKVKSLKKAISTFKKNAESYPKNSELSKMYWREYYKSKNELDELQPKVNIELDKIDVYIAEKYNSEIKGKFSNLEILSSAFLMRSDFKNEFGANYKIKFQFVFNFIFDEFIEELLKLKGLGWKYDKSDDGDIRFMFENYKKVSASIKNDELQKKEILKKEIKLGITEKLRVKFTTDCRELNEEIVVQDNKIFNEYGQELGGLYPDFENKLSNSVYKIRDSKIDKSGMGATIYVKIA